MKKIFAAALAAVMVLSLFSACSKEEAPGETYSGVLTKVRLGMPMNKIISLNSGREMYYESETQIWCVNPDTDLMEIRELIPEDKQFYYAEDSLITYNFKYDEGDDTNYLVSYMEEVPCMLDRATAETYYNDKITRLKAKYGAGDDAVHSTVTGVEGVDMTLINETVMTLPSFKLTFVMNLTYDTVDAVEDYYGTYYSIEVKSLENKTAVDVSGSSEK